MLSQLKRINFINILNFLFQSTLLYLLLTLCQFFFIGEQPPLYNGKLLTAAPIIILTSKLFDNKAYYFLFLGIFTIIGITPAIIKIIIAGYLNVTAYNNLLSFLIVTSNLIILLISLLKKNFCSRFLIPIPILIYTLQIIVFWGYYLSNKSLFNVSTVLALFQTNLTESIEYVQTYINFSALLLALTLILFFVFFSIYIISKIKIRDIHTFAPLLLLLFLGNLWLGYRCRANIIVSPYVEAKNYLSIYSDFNKNKVARQNQLSITTQPYNGLYVVVIGESHTYDYTSAYGYSEETTPWLNEISGHKNTIFMPNAYSCHVQTVPCLTYAMTSKNQYNTQPLEKSPTLIEVAETAGFHTIWLSNQLKFGVFDSPITTIAQEADDQIWINSDKLSGENQAYDGEIISQLPKLQLKEKTLVIIHLMGSHANYTHRYPEEFRYFLDDTPYSNYKNTLRYNDYIVKNIYEYFSNFSNFQALTYFSDHGELPGQGHDPNKYQKCMSHIPFYIILSDNYVKEHEIKFNKLKRAENFIITNDLIYNNILSLMNIKLKNGYEPENDLTSTYYNNNTERFLTLHGKMKIFD